MKKIVGIVGGMGPFAGIDLAKKIVDNTLVKKDSDHISTILFTLPELVPDRTEFLLGYTLSNPAEGIISILDEMVVVGVSVVCLACNTSHSNPILSRVLQHIEVNNLGVELVSMVGAVVDKVLDTLAAVKKVGVLATDGTVYNDVYGKAFREHGIDVIYPPEQLQRECVHDVIYNTKYGIKAVSNPISNEARIKLNCVLDWMIKANVDVVILACTELPLAIREEKYKNVLLLDSTKELARKLICTVSEEKLIEL